MWRLFFLAASGRGGNHRNWPGIDEWAAGIAADLTGVAVAHLET